LLKVGAQIGTGSLRRQAQLRHARPDLVVSEVRGNVDTRLRKLDAGEFDAIVLARAGLMRLGFVERISFELRPPVMLPAVGQGALAIECRADDAATRCILAKLDHAETRASVLAERALLAELRGGCLAPIGAWGRVESGILKLTAVVLDAAGRRRLDAHGETSKLDAHGAWELGRNLASDLLARGAAELIAGSRGVAGGADLE
jgi:hydroxymethylbilane synthase